MKVALVLKGLSYVQNVEHDNDRGTPYTIDFDQSINSFKEKIINPLRENGHQVDIFFHTNKSEKLDKYINELDPVSVSTYDYSFGKSSWTSIDELMLKGALMVKYYQEDDKDKEYDYVIITRFDIYIFENILNLFNTYIPEVGLSVITPNNDCFFIFNGCLLDKMIKVLYFLYINGEVSHRFTEAAAVNDIKVHTFYNYTGACTKESMQVPFICINRHIFTEKTHNWYIHTIEECLDPKSKHYAFQHLINTEFKSGVSIAEWWKPYTKENFIGLNI